jgi:cation diffusion facilitator CzcD-associated flavoprotein CzcO
VIRASGLAAGTGALARVDVHGRNGRSLTERWKRDVRSALGPQVPGFPNLFTVAGPLAPSTALCNMATCLQQQVDWVTDAIVSLREYGRSWKRPPRRKQNGCSTTTRWPTRRS